MKKILIVDDNLEFLRLLSSLLEQDQLLIYKAAGVQEAIELLENTTVDAICSDYGMRDGTGLELFQKLRLRDVKIPFMIMSCQNSIMACREPASPMDKSRQRMTSFSVTAPRDKIATPTGKTKEMLEVITACPMLMYG